MPRWRPRLPDTLLLRLLLAQAITALAMAAVFAGVLYIDRSRTVGRLIAERWAPELRQMLRTPAPADGHAPTGTVTVLRSPQAPVLTVRGALGGPRLLTLRHVLRERGVAVQEIGLVVEAGQQPVIWMAVPDPARPGAPPLWLGLRDELFEPHLPLRLLVAFALALLIIGAVSLTMARRLARPLEALRRRIEQHRPQAVAGTDPRPDDGPIAGATREVAAIDAAWQASQQRLAQHERERALLLAGISHDLRSPLARIRMAAELLPEAPLPPEMSNAGDALPSRAEDPIAATLARVAHRREAILRNTEVADRLIGSFLDQVRSLTLALDERVDVAALARQLVQDRLAAGVRQLSLDAPDTPLWLPQANRLLLERVLANLLDNAFKHGRPPVMLRVQCQPPDHLCIAVEDNGPGIPPEQVPQLLHAFARGDASRGTPGTGLGLSVVAQVVRRLGGELMFEPRSPGGWRVRLVLPLPQHTAFK